MLFNILGGGGSPQEMFIEIFSYLAALVIAFMMHELAHAYVAKWNGDDTAQLMGRLSFNPLKHLDPLGTICLLLVGFGWAKPVPINSRNFRNFRKGFFLTAIAGVTMNLILALLFTGILHLVLRTAVPLEAGSAAFVMFNMLIRFLLYGVMINISLMTFNLLPVPPLDGFRVLEALGEGKVRFVDKYIEFLRRYPFITLLVIIAADRMNIFSTIIMGFLRLLGLAQVFI
ncbi:MAG: site-2 protease family protein [Clostridiales bacterium]|jgi:Zn-dependent protease|nr:site-2 protease family protein [Clostridiales bacterium]